jgi:drug/metabolite transporter (DMT)-like permease
VGVTLLKFGTEHQKEEFEKGAFYMVLSSAMLSLFTLFSKFGTETVSYALLIFLRFAIPLALLLPYLLWISSFKELFSTSHFKIQLLRCASILLYQYAIIYYLMQTSLLDATVMQNTGPLFMPILERVFFKHRFEKKVIVSIGISFVGVLCILQPSSSLFANLGIAGFLAAFGQAGSQVLYRHQARNENQRSNLFYLFFICSLFSGVVFLFSIPFGKPQIVGEHSSWTWVNLVFLGLTSIFNQSLRGEAYKHGKASALAPFLYISIILSAILDWLIFDYLPNWLTLAGTVLVISGGLLQLYKSKSRL